MGLQQGLTCLCLCYRPARSLFFSEVVQFPHLVSHFCDFLLLRTILAVVEVLRPIISITAASSSHLGVWLCRSICKTESKKVPLGQREEIQNKQEATKTCWQVTFASWYWSSSSRERRCSWVFILLSWCHSCHRLLSLRLSFCTARLG